MLWSKLEVVRIILHTWSPALLFSSSVPWWHLMLQNTRCDIIMQHIFPLLQVETNEVEQLCVGNGSWPMGGGLVIHHHHHQKKLSSPYRPLTCNTVFAFCYLIVWICYFLWVIFIFLLVCCSLPPFLSACWPASWTAYVCEEIGRTVNKLIVWLRKSNTSETRWTERVVTSAWSIRWKKEQAQGSYFLPASLDVDFQGP